MNEYPRDSSATGHGPPQQMPGRKAGAPRSQTGSPRTDGVQVTRQHVGRCHEVASTFNNCRCCSPNPVDASRTTKQQEGFDLRRDEGVSSSASPTPDVPRRQGRLFRTCAAPAAAVAEQLMLRRVGLADTAGSQTPGPLSVPDGLLGHPSGAGPFGAVRDGNLIPLNYWRHARKTRGPGVDDDAETRDDRHPLWTPFWETCTV
jgi:hypothetical protein